MEMSVFGRSAAAAVRAGVRSQPGQSLSRAGALPLADPFQRSPAMASHCQQDLSWIKGEAEDGREEFVALGVEMLRGQQVKLTDGERGVSWKGGKYRPGKANTSLAQPALK